MRRMVAVSLLVVTLVSARQGMAGSLLGQDGGADPVGQTTETTEGPEVPTQDIVPRPDSGRPPEDAGDRGGVLQAVVLVAIVVGVGFIALRVTREARRHRPGATGDG